MPESDMEITEERIIQMKQLLAKLYADQIGMEVKNIKVKPIDREHTE